MEKLDLKKTILITGAAGFIGFHLAKVLLEMGASNVIGFDSVNDYYDVGLKEARLKILNSYKAFRLVKGDLADNNVIEQVFYNNKIDIIVHLAAQAGVRYSLTNPRAYLNSNLIGFFNILNLAVKYKVIHFVYASSSSVYGYNEKVPFSVNDKTDSPVSLYAATKKSNELLAYSYSNIYNLPVTGLRFFTVYGPYGRPDMAYFSFTQKILKSDQIDVFNNGNLYRDFTYIDDIVKGIVSVMLNCPPKDKHGVPSKIYNIGNNKPENLMTFISILEKVIGKKAVINFVPMQKGDVYQTFADVDDLVQDFDFKPSTKLEEGLTIFYDWYKKFYKTES